VIKPGAVADFIVVDGQPESDIEVLTDPSRITLVCQDGRLRK
jgi:imidazolonepropionase-like amidohydrolase